MATDAEGKNLAYLKLLQKRTSRKVQNTAQPNGRPTDAGRSSGARSHADRENNFNLYFSGANKALAAKLASQSTSPNSSTTAAATPGTASPHYKRQQRTQAPTNKQKSRTLDSIHQNPTRQPTARRSWKIHKNNSATSLTGSEKSRPAPQRSKSPAGRTLNSHARVSKSPPRRSRSPGRAPPAVRAQVKKNTSKLNYSDDFDNLTDSLSDISTYYSSESSAEEVSTDDEVLPGVEEHLQNDTQVLRLSFLPTDVDFAEKPQQKPPHISPRKRKKPKNGSKKAASHKKKDTGIGPAGAGQPEVQPGNGKKLKSVRAVSEMRDGYNTVKLELVANFAGSYSRMGLSEIEMFSQGQKYHVPVGDVTISGVWHMRGCVGNLLNGGGDGESFSFMPMTRTQAPTIVLKYSCMKPIEEIHLWNYRKQNETQFGIKHYRLYLNDTLVREHKTVDPAENPHKIYLKPRAQSQDADEMSTNPTSFFVDLNTVNRLSRQNSLAAENIPLQRSDSQASLVSETGTVNSDLNVPSTSVDESEHEDMPKCPSRSETRIMNYTDEERRARPRVRIDPINHSIDVMQSFDRMPQLEREKTFVNADTTEKIEPELDKTITPEKLGVNEIPNLPTGKRLIIHMLSNWGDDNFIAFTSLEIFDSSGSKIHPIRCDVDGPELHPNDPRSDVMNLFNGKNSMRDGLNAWMAPLLAQRNKLVATFEESASVAMLRFYNYGRSRVESLRGIKDVNVTLDGETIFAGEVKQSDSETILFTTNDGILEKIARLDPNFEAGSRAEENDHVVHKAPKLERIQSTLKPRLNRDRTFFQGQNSIQSQKTDVLKLQLLLNWQGGHNVFTFRQITFTGDGGQRVYPDKVKLVNCSLRGDGDELERMTSLKCQGIATHDIVIEADDPNSSRKLPEMEFSFEEEVDLVLLTLVNGSDSIDSSWNSIANFKMLTSNVSFRSADILIARKWPGHNHCRQTQYVPIDSTVHNALKPLPNNHKFPYPRGFLYEIQLLSTCGDPFYIGLNGIEATDHRGKLIELTMDNIAAQPGSVNDLHDKQDTESDDDVEPDCRTLDKIIDGENEDTQTAEHSWLAPVMPGKINRLYILFDRLQPVSKIKVWNYGKTPSRGVREYNVLVDGMLLCNGELMSAQRSGSLPTEIDLKTAMMRQHSSESKPVSITKTHQRRAKWSHRNKRNSNDSSALERPKTSCTPNPRL